MRARFKIWKFHMRGRLGVTISKKRTLSCLSSQFTFGSRKPPTIDFSNFCQGSLARASIYRFSFQLKSFLKLLKYLVVPSLPLVTGFNQQWKKILWRLCYLNSLILCNVNFNLVCVYLSFCPHYFWCHQRTWVSSRINLITNLDIMIHLHHIRSTIT